MAKKAMSESKNVKGNDYEEKSEKMEQMKAKKKSKASTKVAGMQSLLKKSQKEQGISKLPSVKKSVKGKGLIK
jgi:hypothetical protein